MQFLRIFSGTNFKGTRNYLKTQKKYEVIRTVIYFGISISLFIAGWVATKERINLLTVVAILGCLPASKSAVGMIMYLRYQGCSRENADAIETHTDGLNGMFDMVFTSYDKNYQVDHVTVKGNTICGFTRDNKFDEQSFNKHISAILKAENYKDASVKIFIDLNKYVERLEQLKKLDTDETHTLGIMDTLKSVSL